MNTVSSGRSGCVQIDSSKSSLTLFILLLLVYCLSVSSVAHSAAPLKHWRAHSTLDINMSAYAWDFPKCFGVEGGRHKSEALTPDGAAEKFAQCVVPE